MDLKILDAGKDYWIKQLREERDGFLRQLGERSRRIGALEAELRQLTVGRGSSDGHLPRGLDASDTRDTTDV
jgi:hypothetical protein